MADNFRRDFESVEEYHARLDREAAELATFETDLGKVLEQPAPPKPPVIGPSVPMRPVWPVVAWKQAMPGGT